MVPPLPSTTIWNVAPVPSLFPPLNPVTFLYVPAVLLASVPASLVNVVIAPVPTGIKLASNLGEPNVLSPGV